MRAQHTCECAHLVGANAEDADVMGFVNRKPIWLMCSLGLSAVRKETELMGPETSRFCETATQQTSDAGIRQLLVVRHT